MKRQLVSRSHGPPLFRPPVLRLWPPWVEPLFGRRNSNVLLQRLGLIRLPQRYFRRTIRHHDICRVQRCLRCLRLDLMSVAVARMSSELSWQFWTVSCTVKASFFAVLTLRLRFVALLFTMSAGVTASLHAVAEISFPLPGIIVITVKLIVASARLIMFIASIIWR